jgi:hypothetical protein
VNAAFLLVTTAWLAGADAGDKPEQLKNPPKTQPGAGTPTAPLIGGGYAGGGYAGGSGGCGCTSGDCGSCCDGGDMCGCESGGHRLLGKLRGMFRRSSCGCESTCDTCPSTCAPSAPVSCGCASYDCGCGCESGGHRLFGKLRGLFRRGGSCGCETDCCDTGGSCGCVGGGGYSGGGYGGYGGYGAPVITAPITNGKPADQMPKGGGDKNGGKGGGDQTSNLKPITAPSGVPSVTVETEKNPF